MGQQTLQMDVESLQSRGRRRGSCLDAFLVMSIMFLFVAVAAVAVAGAMVVMELRSKVETQLPNFESETSRQTGVTPSPVYKMENCVYLETDSSQLKTSTMRWVTVPYGSGTSLGSNFVLDADQSSLKPVREGTYFMYINLNLSCTERCKAGVLTVSVGEKLTCKVNLTENSTTASRKCWTVMHLEEEGLLTQMTVPEEGLENWKLELSSGFGMFLVD